MLRRALLAIIAVVAVGVSAAGLWLHHNLWRAHNRQVVDLEIIAGSSAHEILAQLHAQKLLGSVLAGRIYLRANPSRAVLHYGHYRFPADCHPVDALETILDGAVEMFSVTVVEGSDAAEIGAHFAQLGVGTDEEWRQFGRRVEWIKALAPGAPSLEGFLFPDTYRFAVGIPPESVARYMVRRFEQVWSEEASDSGTLLGSTLEIVTLASLVEAETSLDGERPLIAGVFANRLKRGMLLQCDPTVVYSLKRRGEWKGRLLRVHWEVDDPYNTYRYAGLPPGPINSPGRAALAAAIRPETTQFLYFVAKPGGGHSFSKTLSEHNRAVARLLSSRR